MRMTARRRVPGLNPERADIVMAGAAILEGFMQALQIPAIRISDRGLREGLLMDYLLRRGHAPALQDLSVRQRSVLDLGRTCRFDETHGRTTAHLALALFDSAGAANLHPFGAWERELLEHAALLHRIGAFLTYNNYQAHTHYLIRNANLLGFDETEVAIIAATALFHRKAVPQREHPEFAALDRQAQKIVRVLSLLLRFAESLDRSHAGNVEHARLRLKDGSRAGLFIYTVQDCQIELMGGAETRRGVREGVRFQAGRRGCHAEGRGGRGAACGLKSGRLPLGRLRTSCGRQGASTVLICSRMISIWPSLRDTRSPMPIVSLRSSATSSPRRSRRWS